MAKYTVYELADDELADGRDTPCDDCAEKYRAGDLTQCSDGRTRCAGCRGEWKDIQKFLKANP